MADQKIKDLEEQLKKIGANYRFWGRSEIRELAHVLLPGEIVRHCVNGSYDGGFAMLAATNQRVLLIDKKPFYLTLEDIRFDMISEIDYNHRLLNSTVLIQTPNKSMRFLGYNQYRLRQLFHFVQTQVMEIRQHYQQQGQLWKEYAQGLQPTQPITPDQTFAQPQFTPDMAQQLNVAVAQPEAQTNSPAPPTIQQRMPIHPSSYHTVAPVVSAYTRLPMMSRQRRFLGSRAVHAPISSAYYQRQ